MYVMSDAQIWLMPVRLISSIRFGYTRCDRFESVLFTNLFFGLACGSNFDRAPPLADLDSFLLQDWQQHPVSGSKHFDSDLFNLAANVGIEPLTIGNGDFRICLMRR